MPSLVICRALLSEWVPEFGSRVAQRRTALSLVISYCTAVLGSNGSTINSPTPRLGLMAEVQVANIGFSGMSRVAFAAY